MKIVYLVHQFFPEYYTGTEKFVYKISSMMQKAGHGVRVITYSFYRDSFFDKSIEDILYREFAYKGVPVTAIRHKNIPENINVVLGDKSIARIAEHFISIEKPDIVHIGHPMRVNEFIAASKLLAIPYIITLTDFWLICPKVNLFNSKGNLCTGPGEGNTCKNLCPELPEDLVIKRAEFAKDILTNAKRVISPSMFLRSLYENELGLPDMEVINHGISLSKIKKNNKHYEKEDELIFSYAGSLNDHKGIHILIDAFKMIKSNDVILKIFGSGQDHSYVNRLLGMVKNDERIEFCGVYSGDDVGNVFSNVDVVVIPSIVYESYSLVLHEALACNIPVIASDVGSMAEKIKDGFNGFSFPAGDVKALKNIMEAIIANPGMLNSLKKNIRGSSVPTVEQEAYAYARIYSNIERLEGSSLSKGFREGSRANIYREAIMMGHSIWNNSSERYQKNRFKLYWELLSEVQKYQYKCMTGNENIDFLTFTLQYCKENFEYRNLRALWIGCMDSNPGPEVTQFESGIFSKIEVMDIAGRLLDKQREITSKRGLRGIEYIRQDLNEVALEENAYDIIFALGTIHHVENLERLFEQINNALKENGKLIMREYVGPNHVQFTDKQLSIINEILSILPEKYKTMINGVVKNVARSPDINYLMKVDPSESIRSQDIIKITKEKLEIIKLTYTGGTILHPLLSEIASNFEQDQDADTVLKLLILFERILIERGVLASDYCFCIAKKKLSV